MPAAVISITKRGEEAGIPLGNNNKLRFFDVSADTGTYTTGGFQITAAQLGFTSVYYAAGSTATSGTAGATANGVGIIHAAGGASINVQVYEAAATGLALLEKTSGEAYEANWTFRLMAIGQ